MNEQPKRPELPADFKTCDTCKWGRLLPDGKIMCYGGPPTPVLMGARPGKLAHQVEFQAELLRPILPKGTEACRVHESKIALIGAT